MPTKIVAHRGDSENAPENTIAAFDSARDAGADAIEFDVLPSSEGAAFVHHDYYLGRTSDGIGPVHIQSAAALSRLDAGAWFHPSFRGERIPRLADILDRYGDTLRYEIEIKWPDNAFVESVLEAVLSRELLDNVEFTSPFREVLKLVRIVEPDAKIGVFLPAFPEWMEPVVGRKLLLGTVALGRYDVAHCPLSVLDSDLIAGLREGDVRIHAANCDDDESLRRALEMGVDQVSTTKIARAVALRLGEGGAKEA